MSDLLKKVVQKKVRCGIMTFIVLFDDTKRNKDNI